MKWVKLWLKCYIPCINSQKTCLRVKSDGCKCWKRLKIDRKQFKIVRKQLKIVRKAVKRPTWYGLSSYLFNRSSNVSSTRPEGTEALSPGRALKIGYLFQCPPWAKSFCPFRAYWVISTVQVETFKNVFCL